MDASGKSLIVRIPISKDGMADFSRCENLQVLNTEGNKEVRTIKFHGNGVNVKEVNVCDCTNLTEINISAATNLESFNANRTAIRSLKLPGSKKLEYIQFIGCINLETLDASECGTFIMLNCYECANLSTLMLPDKIIPPNGRSRPKIKVDNCQKLNAESRDKLNVMKANYTIAGLESLEPGYNEKLLQNATTLTYNRVYKRFEDQNRTLIITDLDCDLTICEKLREIAIEGNDEMLSIKLPDKCASLTTITIRNCNKLHALTFPKDLSANVTINVTGCPSLDNVTPLDNLPISEKISIPGRKEVATKVIGVKCLKDKNAFRLMLNNGFIEVPYNDGALDLSECENLNSLVIVDVPELKNITFPKHHENLKAIHIISCGSIKGLDLSTCENLTSLSVCECGSLCELTLPTNKTQLNDVHRSALAVNAVDISGYANLSDITITSCGHISKLIFSGNAKLRKLYLYNLPKIQPPNFNSFPNLQILHIVKCKLITAIDVCSCSQMTTIESDNNTKSVIIPHGNIEIRKRFSYYPSSEKKFDELLQQAINAKKAEEEAAKAKVE
jgi:hypothetical protein